MKRVPTVVLATVAMAIAMLSGLPGSAVANARAYNYAANAGGSTAQVLGSVVASDLTAQSSVAGWKLPNSSSNALASAKVASLASIKAVQTSAVADRAGDGVKITSTARTAGLSLLNGLVTADVVRTVNTTTGSATGALAGSSQTDFVNLKVAGLPLLLRLAQNTTISIPGVATLSFNGSTSTQHDGIIESTGYGLKITLLQAGGGLPAGATVVLNPTYVALSPAGPVDQPTLGGYAYGSQVLVNVGPQISAQVGRTASVGTPPGGTGGKTVSNSTLRVNVPGVVAARVISSTTNATTRAGFGEVTNTNETAGLDLFDGLITADVIKVSAHSKRVGGVLTRDAHSDLINLKIAGASIPVGVPANTAIDVAGIGTVVINQQVQTTNGNLIRGIYIKLLEPRAGLKVGAEIEVAAAATLIN